MTPSVEIELAGESMVVRGDRTLFWPARSTLFVADLHLGKGAAFRAGGVPVPSGSTAATLDSLSRSVLDTKAERLIVLGDLWHARAGRTTENREALARWRGDRPELQTLLVIGNHDRGAGWELDAVEEGYGLAPFVLRHHPEPDAAGYVLCGHLHPGFRLEGVGRQSLRLPCFWLGAEVGVLPAFGDLTGSAEVRPATGDGIYVVAEGKVAKVPVRDRFAARRR